MCQFIRLGLADVEVILDLADGEIIVVELLGFVHNRNLLIKMQSKSAMQVGTRIALHYIHKEVSFYRRSQNGGLRNGSEMGIILP